MSQSDWTPSPATPQTTAYVHSQWEKWELTWALSTGEKSALQSNNERTDTPNIKPGISDNLLL